MQSFDFQPDIFTEIWTLLGKLTHKRVAQQLEYLKLENQILRSKLSKRISLTHTERNKLLHYGLLLGKDMKSLISIVNYSTFRKWVRDRLKKKVKIFKKRGRPKTFAEISDLIIRLARENNWGYTRILGELRKLNIFRISRSTIKNILKENNISPVSQRSSDSWDAFIHRHFETLMACDFFTQTVWTVFGPRTFFVLFFINIRTREVTLSGTTKSPNNTWLFEKTQTLPFFQNNNISKKHLLIRDNDALFSKNFDHLFKEQNFKVKRTPYKSPNLNAYAESWIGTIQRECLNHFIFFGKKHFEYIVKEYIEYYNTKRPHSSMNHLPLDKNFQRTIGKAIKCEETLGGIIKHYYRE